MKKKMRVAIAQIHHESNTFTPQKTTLENFHRRGIYEGIEILDRYYSGRLGGRIKSSINGFIPVLKNAGVEIVPLISYESYPVHFGPVTQETFRLIEKHLTSSLVKALPLDSVLINFHGAMVTEEIEDGEGYLMERVREIIGSEIPLVVTFDPHAFVTRKKAENALIVGYKTYPHIDQVRTGEKAAELVLGMIRGGINAQDIEVGFIRLPMIIPATSTTTEAGAFKYLMELTDKAEEDEDIVRSNIFSCQPWLDISKVGWSITVYGFDKTKVQEWVRKIAKESWIRKEEFRLEKTPMFPFVSPEEAIREAVAHDGKPVAVIDTGDLVPGDSTILLGEMLRQKIECEALITMVDPEAVKICNETGVGNTVRLKLGGKMETLFSKPLDVEGKVRALFASDIGRSSFITALLEIGQIKVVITQTLDGGSNYQSAGLVPEKAQIWVMKGARGNLTSELKSVASKILLVGVPGYAMSDVKQLPFNNIPKPFYPFDAEEEKYIKLHKKLLIDKE